MTVPLGSAKRVLSKPGILGKIELSLGTGKGQEQGWQADKLERSGQNAKLRLIRLDQKRSNR